MKLTILTGLGLALATSGCSSVMVADNGVSGVLRPRRSMA